MTWLARGTLLRVLAPLAAGVALAVALQAAEPATRLYTLISPSLLAGLAGLAGTGVLAAVALTRRRAAIRAGLANIDQDPLAGAAAADGTSAALASVSAQADRITRLVSDLRKLADLETQEIETALVDLPGLLHEVAEAAAEIPGASQ